jgi:hypothetical protein
MKTVAQVVENTFGGFLWRAADNEAIVAAERDKRNRGKYARAVGFVALALDGLLDAADRELAHLRATADRGLRELSELRHDWDYHFWRP